MNYIIGEPGSEEAEEQRFREICTSTASALASFIQSADELIADVLAEMHWTLREVDASS
jgi:hypothetical protein